MWEGNKPYSHRCLSFCIPAFRHTSSLPILNSLIPFFFFACHLPSPGTSPLSFHHFSDENPSWQQRVLPTPLCRVQPFHRIPESLGLGKTNCRSRSATCDQSQLVQTDQSTQCHISEVVHFQNIVSPPKKVFFSYNSPVFQPYLSGVQRTQGATGSTEIPAATQKSTSFIFSFLPHLQRMKK